MSDLNPFLRRRDEADALWVLGGRYTFSARGSDVGNAYTLVEVTAPAGFAIPVHLHRREDEGFYVASGEVTFSIDGERAAASAGTTAFVPRNVPHAFRLETADTRLLLLITPGAAGHESLFTEMGEPAAGPGLPPPPQHDPDQKILGEIAARHGTRLLGPPLGS
jgi:quercetin dioxygenase-like cupin family protein